MNQLRKFLRAQWMNCELMSCIKCCVCLCYLMDQQAMWSSAMCQVHEKLFCQLQFCLLHLSSVASSLIVMSMSIRRCVPTLTANITPSNTQWRSDGGARDAGRTGRHLLGAPKGRKTPKIKKKFT